MSTKIPLAMTPPQGDLVRLTNDMAHSALEMSRLSPRKRIIQPLHQSEEETLHRMFNALQPGTYVRPHHHREPPKQETIVVLSGRVRFLRFEEDGILAEWFDAGSGCACFGMDIYPNVLHSFIVLEPDTLIFEVKHGPYQRVDDKHFPAWAPAEGTPEAEAYLRELLRLTENGS